MTYDRPNLLSSKTGEHSFYVPKILYQNRYCDLDDFNIMVCGGTGKNYTTLNDVYEINLPNFECSKFPSMLEARLYCKTGVVNSDIVAVGGSKNAGSNVYSVELFNNNNKARFYKTEFSDKGTNFSICTFKQNLFIIGGLNDDFQTLKSCFIYNMKSDKRSQIADMNENREGAACTIYEGKLWRLEITWEFKFR